MKLFLLKLVAVLLASPVNVVTSTSYDYSASLECLAEPLEPQYRGGIITNPSFDDGARGWSGDEEARTSHTGNRYLVAHKRTKPHQSATQEVHLRQGMLYTFSAWLRSSEGSCDVVVIFKTGGELVSAGAVEASSGCWSMLKGGLTVDHSGPATLSFQSNNSAAEIWVDSVSLQPFTAEEWRSHQTESIRRARTEVVRLRVVDGNGEAVPNATVFIQQRRPGFPFGCAMPQTILTNAAYQSWFTSRFTVTTFENEMKWYSTERSPGWEDYSVADAMVAFAQRHGIAVRGHNVFWDDPKYQMGWVTALYGEQLRNAANRRLFSVVSRYRGKVIAWDVVNENLHFSFFEERLGGSFSGEAILQASKIDPGAVMFLNDYNTLEQPGDPASTPEKYARKLAEMKAYTKNTVRIGIGLESHFNQPNIPFMRAALDKLARAGVPIWLTEVDVFNSPNQARYLEEILREGYGHPAVQGIVIWGGWHQEGCNRMCLTDNSFRNLATGDVVDRLLKEWRSEHVAGTTDGDGLFQARLFHGEHDIVVVHPSRETNVSRELTVAPSSSPDDILHVVVL